VPKLKKWGMMYGRLFGRYLIDKNERVRHRSETCVVVFATYFDSVGKEVKVALKFMENDEYFKKEINSRQKILEKASSEDEARDNVVLVNKAFTANRSLSDSSDLIEYRDDFSQELELFKNIRLEGSGDRIINHILEMSCGLGDDLSDVISHQDIAGKNLVSVCQIALSIAKVLRFLNETCHILHGDVKPRNFIVWKTGGQCVAIDLDNSRDISNLDDTGGNAKETSSGYLPPEHAVLLCAQRTTGKMIDAKELAGLEKKRRRYQNLLENEDDEEMRSDFEEKILSIQDVIHGATPTEIAESGLIPTKPSEMWRFGFLLYQLCTNSDLFHLGNHEQVLDNEILKKIRDWNNDDLQKKLALIPDNNWGKQFKPLLERLLQRNPDNRPKTWDEIITTLNGGISEHDVRVEMSRVHRGVDRLLELTSRGAPRYMLVLPLKFGIEDKLNLTALVNKKVLVVFLCPVTLIVPRNENGDIMGYEFNFTRDWYERWGPGLRIGFMYLSLAIKVYSSAVVNIRDPIAPETHITHGNLGKLLKENVSWLQKYAAADTVNNNINREAINIEDPDAIRRLSGEDLDKLRCTYEEVMNVTQNDKEFLKSGLRRQYCASDNTSEYVLNIPEATDLYQEKGKECLNTFANTEAMKGCLTRKRERKLRIPSKEKTRYYVLRINGHLSHYKDRNEYEDNHIFGLEGETKPRYMNVSSVDGELGIEIEFVGGKNEVLYADSLEMRNKWVEKMQAVNHKRSVCGGN
jgi:serine/threonine protein kinase